MTQNDFILQYVAANIAGRAIEGNLSFHKTSLEKSIATIIKEAEWVWEALPDTLKETEIKKS